MPVRLVICDIDGTLIPDDTQFLDVPGSSEFLQFLNERQVPFALASGRAYSSVVKAFKGVPISLPVITGNGISLVQDGKPVWSCAFMYSLVSKAAEKARDMGISVIFNDGIEDTVESLYGWAKARTARNGHPYIVTGRTPQSTIGKVLFADDCPKGRISEIQALIPESDEIEVLRYGSHYLDVMPKGCSKGKAMSQMLSILGIDPHDVIAMGNESNDLEMIQIAGTGVAVANSPDSLKMAADYVCKGSALDGVLEALRKHL